MVINEVNSPRTGGREDRRTDGLGGLFIINPNARQTERHTLIRQIPFIRSLAPPPDVEQVCMDVGTYSSPVSVLDFLPCNVAEPRTRMAGLGSVWVGVLLGGCCREGEEEGRRREIHTLVIGCQQGRSNPQSLIGGTAR